MSTAELDAMQWTDISMDPNSPAALDERRRAAGFGQGPASADRLEFIRTMVRGRRVLDVGCVDHFADAAVEPGFLHRAVAASAGECLGIDVHGSGVEALARWGFAVRGESTSTTRAKSRSFVPAVASTSLWWER